jgi:hypothetical protein
MKKSNRGRILDGLMLVARAELEPSQLAMLAARLLTARTAIQQIAAICRQLKAAVK